MSSRVVVGDDSVVVVVAVVPFRSVVVVVALRVVCPATRDSFWILKDLHEWTMSSVRMIPYSTCYIPFPDKTFESSEKQ